MRLDETEPSAAQMPTGQVKQCAYVVHLMSSQTSSLKLKSTCSCPGYTPGRQTGLLSITKSLQCSKMQQQHNETHGIQLHSSANNSTVLCSNILSLQNNNSSHWHSGCRSNWWGAGEDFWKRSALEEIDVIAAVVSFVAACHVELARREFKINFQRRRRLSPRRHRDIHLSSNCQHMSRQLQYILILQHSFPPRGKVRLQTSCPERMPMSYPLLDLPDPSKT